MSAGPKSCPAGLEIFGVRRRPDFCGKCIFVLKSNHPPAGQACQPSTQPQAQACLKQPPTRPRRMPATRPAPSSQPASRLSAACQGQVCLTCLRPRSLVCRYASLRLASGPVRLLACLTCLRLASGPAQPATRHPASGPSVYETGPTRPSTAQVCSQQPCG